MTPDNPQPGFRSHCVRFSRSACFLKAPDDPSKWCPGCVQAPRFCAFTGAQLPFRALGQRGQVQDYAGARAREAADMARRVASLVCELSAFPGFTKEARGILRADLWAIGTYGQGSKRITTAPKQAEREAKRDDMARRGLCRITGRELYRPPPGRVGPKPKYVNAGARDLGVRLRRLRVLLGGLTMTTDARRVMSDDLKTAANEGQTFEDTVAQA